MKGRASNGFKPPSHHKILNLVPCSTVSGSGIDFFRKFVQRKGDGCRECEDRFRREVLIDRLVSDSLNRSLSVSSTKGHGSISACLSA